MDQRTRITKKLLFDSLIEMLQEKEIDQISVAELCRRADVNRTTFYRYYQSPQDLFNDLETSELKKTYRLITGNHSEDGERLRESLRYMLENRETAIALNDKFLKKCSRQSKVTNEGDFSSEYLSGGCPEKYMPYVHIIFLSASKYWLTHEDRLPPEEYATFLEAISSALKSLPD